MGLSRSGAERRSDTLAIFEARPDSWIKSQQAIARKNFQPFFTTKPTGEGTGLGLSLSYDIITEGHGGSLTVESQEGQGTTFVIQLPCSWPHQESRLP